MESPGGQPPDPQPPDDRPPDSDPPGERGPEASGEAPLKICRRCSVAARTTSDVCPSCGTPYERRGLGRLPGRPLVWLAIPIIIAGFAVGYFGRKLIEGDDADAGVITLEQAAAVQQGISRSELVDELGTEPAATEGDCEYYAISAPDEALADEERVWEFCFTEDQLETTGLAG